MSRIVRVATHDRPTIARGTQRAVVARMQKSRLFPTLILFGASLTGGAIATVATVSIAVAVSGCGGDDTSTGYAIIDMGVPIDLLGHYPDIGLPRDMARHD